jgi:hypothetical protein
VIVSTWDQEAEGTGVSPGPECSDLYLQITRQYAAQFNGGFIPPDSAG